MAEIKQLKWWKWKCCIVTCENSRDTIYISAVYSASSYQTRHNTQLYI